LSRLDNVEDQSNQLQFFIFGWQYRFFAFVKWLSYFARV